MSQELPELTGAIEPVADEPGEPSGRVSPPVGGTADRSSLPVDGPTGPTGSERAAAGDPRDLSRSDPPRCGRWKLKPFELPRPVLLRPDGPLSLAEFLDHPDQAVLDAFSRLSLEEVQALVLARLQGAPPDMQLSLFGQPGYSMRDVVRHVEEGTPLGVRIIDAERKLVGLLLTEALSAPA